MFSNVHNFGPDRNVSTTIGWFASGTEIDAAQIMIPKELVDPLIFSFQSSSIHLGLDWTVKLYDFDVPFTFPIVPPLGHGVLYRTVYQHRQTLHEVTSALDRQIDLRAPLQRK